jgi:hypothetical protein
VEPEGTIITPGDPNNGIIFPTGTTPDCTLYVDDVELRTVGAASDTAGTPEKN